MNIFKSKEIYKKVPNVSPQNNPLRAVRGVWVSGEHRDPYCIDSVIQILNMSSNQCTTIDYSVKNVNAYVDGGIVNIQSVEVNGLSTKDYTSKNTNAFDQGVVNIISVSSPPLNVYYYTSKNENTYDKGTVNILEITDNIFTIVSVDSPNVNKETTPEPMIHVLEHGSGDLEFGVATLSDDE